MMPLNTPSIINFGVSAQLQADFDMLREVSFSPTVCSNDSISGNTDIKPYRKFSHKTVDTLAQHIVCRNYSNACYELSHLCWAVLHTSHKTQGALLDYFWIEQVCTSGRFKQFFSAYTDVNPISLKNGAPAQSSLHVVDGTLHITIHQHQFLMSASRSNFLSCMMEWLVCVIPQLLSHLASVLSGKGFNAISEMASMLQKHIYDYIGLHLPPAKLQKRYRLFEAFYLKDNRFPITEVTLCSDAKIMEFWQTHCHLEGHGKYAHVVTETWAFMAALESVRANKNVQFAGNIEDNADTLLACVQQGGYTDELLLGELSEAPKVFSQAQVALAEYLVMYPAYFPDFSVSWLRGVSFGKWQNKLIQATRTRHLNSLPNDDTKDYEHTKTQCLHMIASAQQALLAMVSLLLKNEPEPALEIMLKICKRMPGLRQYHHALLSLIESTDNISHGNIASWQLSQPWFSEQINMCNQALKHINRSGFTPATLLEPQHYIDAAHAVLTVHDKLNQVLNHLLSHKLCDSENFVSDRLIFLDVFKQIYTQGEH